LLFIKIFDIIYLSKEKEVIIMKSKLDIGIIIKKLNKATKAYDKGQPIMSDKEWDNLYFELKEWEDQTGIVFADSPTQKIHF
jgi:NAD-dependent DNA ligase